ncbi:MAG: hypothetical protein NTY43_01200 [Bacteroidetes bacterium]|nr:hypothetical protein [Bacteroidota bacterium]
MKNRLFPILVATLSLLACQKEDTIAIKIEPSLQAFKTDKIVQEFINYNESFINNMGSPNNESIQLLKKISLNNNEQIKLSKLVGFTSLAEYNLFLKNQSALAYEIRRKYSFLAHFSQNELLNLLKELNYNTNSSKKSLMLENRCDDKYNNCSRLSNIVYTAEILGCTATAVGLGALTGGWGGVLFQAACGASALEHLQTMRTGCQLDYEDCK